jgi:hypothetical protein
VALETHDLAMSIISPTAVDINLLKAAIAGLATLESFGIGNQE